MADVDHVLTAMAVFCSHSWTVRVMVVASPPLMVSLGKGDFSLLKYSSAGSCGEVCKGGCPGKAPKGVDGLGTIIAGKAAPCVLATPEGGTAEGTPVDTPVITGVCGKGIACC